MQKQDKYRWMIAFYFGWVFVTSQKKLKSGAPNDSKGTKRKKNLLCMIIINRSLDLLRCVCLRPVVKPSKSTFQNYNNISDEWMWINHFNKTLIFSKQFKFVWFSLSSIKCSWSLLSEVQRGKLFKNSIWQTGTL